MRFAAIGLTALVLALAGIWAAYLFGWWEHTDCHSTFDSSAAAERAASVARAAGFSADVEESGSEARRPTSIGARDIAVTFSDGETGDDAADFRMAVNRLIVEGDGRPTRLEAGCYETPLLGGG
jgi:hypothetical protein